MTVATKLAYLADTKEAIKDAIVAKGVAVAEADTFRSYAAKIAEIETSAPAAEWTKPAEWPDISVVGDNEINLLVTDGAGIAFSTTVAGSGTYSIDWGDGIIENGCTSGAIKQHQYNYSGGTYCPNLGYWVYKIRIFNATGNITRWKVERHTYTASKQFHSILCANIRGLNNITSAENMFFSYAGAWVECPILQTCFLPLNWSLATTSTAYMFQYCRALVYVDLPDSWGNITNCNYMLNGCSALKKIKLPASWGNVTNVGYFVGYCSSLVDVELPESWNNVFYISGFFYNCTGLTNLKIPSSFGNVSDMSYFLCGCSGIQNISEIITWGNSSTSRHMAGMFQFCYSLLRIYFPNENCKSSSMNGAFYGCYNLKEVVNFKIINDSTPIDFTDIFCACESLQQSITIATRLTKLGIYGSSTVKIKIENIRLTNPANTFSGSSPQINVSYTSLGQAALVALFNDLPTLSGKTINITGATGAAALTAGERAIATGKGWTITG